MFKVIQNRNYYVLVGDVKSDYISLELCIFNNNNIKQFTLRQELQKGASEKANNIPHQFSC